MTVIKFPKPDRTNCNVGRVEQVTLTLPVAPRPLARVRFDPVDDKARAVPPSGALRWLAENFRGGAEVDKVILDGPGDPLYDISSTLGVLAQIRAEYPGIACGVSTLGLQGEECAGQLAKAGVSEVTLQVDAVEAEVAEQLYAWIRPGNKTVPLPRAVKLLLDEQPRAARAFVKAGCRVRVRTTVYPGLTDNHVAQVAKTMAACGAGSLILVPYMVPPGSEESLLKSADPELMQSVRKKAARYLETEVAKGTASRLEGNCPSPLGGCSPLHPKPTGARPNLAVVSSNGLEVDLHLGQAYQVMIYGPRADGLISLLGTRPVPEPGSGSNRWQELAEDLGDCFALLAASAGESPRHILGGQDITVLITDGEIEGIVDALYGGGKKKKCS